MCGGSQNLIKSAAILILEKLSLFNKKISENF
jgi:hypothetical protein